MKRRHFDALAPVCPACRRAPADSAPLTLARVGTGTDDEVVEGALRCTRAACQCEFPIIDSIPILVPRVREFVASNSVQLSMRDDLTADSQRMLAEGAGPGSWLDAIYQHLSSYAWDHYAEYDPQEPMSEPRPGGVARALRTASPHLNPKPGAPVIDIGCSVGRATFELATSSSLALGVDTHIPMLRLAQRILRTGQATYLRRRLCMLYEPRQFPVRFEHARNVDFWACDATALPFSPGTFGAALSLNVLDCVPSPLDHLRCIAQVLSKGCRAVLTTPYDWSAHATPIEAWIGGHSPHGFHGGSCEDVLRAILTPGAHPASLDALSLVAEVPHVPWHVRMHERSCMHYDLHMAVAQAT